MGEGDHRSEPTDPPRAGHIKPAREHQPHTEGVPDEEGMTDHDVTEQVDRDPEDQLSRPEQGMPEWERRQYEDPPLEKPLAEHDTPEDR